MNSVSAFQKLKQFQNLGRDIEFLAPDTDSSYEYAYLIFLLSDKFYALPSDTISDIRERPNLNHEKVNMPYSPEWVIGMTAVKNKPLVMLDLALMLDLDSNTSGRKKMLVVRDEEFNVALLVDQVIGLRTAEQKQINKTFEKYTPYEIKNLQHANSNCKVLELKELLMHFEGSQNGELS